MARAVEAARREGAWHWPLDVAPVFAKGGFDLQVGNPPWVRPTWDDDLSLAEFDPWWGIVENPSEAERRARKSEDLVLVGSMTQYLADISSHEGGATLLGSIQLRPLLAGIQTNLYMVFLDTIWRHLAERGTSGLLHPEGHFVDPHAGQLRRMCYRHLRRHWQFNELGRWFSEVASPSAVFGASVYAAGGPPRFLQTTNLQEISTLEGSLHHDGGGPVPAIVMADGGRDLRPHADRIVMVDRDVLAQWARLFDEPGTPAEEARLLRPVTKRDLAALSVLAAQPVRLADHPYEWSAGWHEKGAKSNGIIRWTTTIPTSWDEVILQGPHFTVATPFAKQPNENCRGKGDYSEWDLEHLPNRVIPRTNYQRACDRKLYKDSAAQWAGRPSSEYWRVGWRAMTQPGLERSLHSSLLQPGPLHIGGVFSLTLPRLEDLVRLCALWSALPIDYLVKVSGVSNVKEFLVRTFPLPFSTEVDAWAILRTLRLNCLTAEYSGLWEDLFAATWKTDHWTDEGIPRVTLGDVTPEWTMDTPLRRDFERRLALVEIDALAALMLGLTAEQLCAMYRTQFPVLRKYEYATAFDSEGRKICAHHQSAGYRQSQVQQEAKDKKRAPRWANVWKMFLEWEDDPDSIDWEDQFFPPFTRVDREAEMTRAYVEFQRRLDAGEYG